MMNLFPQGPYDVTVDPLLIMRLELEMRAADVLFRPADVWEIDLDVGVPVESCDLEYMMRMWIGSRSLVTPSPTDFETYEDFYLSIGPGEGFRQLLRAPKPDQMRKFELGTLHDLLLLDKFTNLHNATPDRRPVYLGIGDGFGRVPEGVLHLSGFNARCVLVDVAPATMAWAHAYFRQKYPELAVGILGVDTLAEEAAAKDVLIAPVWHVAKTPEIFNVDVVSSMAALQEMTDEQVDFYKNFIDTVTHEGSVFYLCTSRDYVYPRGYEFSPHWRRRLIRNTPRSLSPDFPAEIYERTLQNETEHNRALEAEYSFGAMARYRTAFRALELDFMDFRKKHNQRVKDMKATIDKLAADKVHLKEVLQRKTAK